MIGKYDAAPILSHDLGGVSRQPRVRRPPLHSAPLQVPQAALFQRGPG